MKEKKFYFLTNKRPNSYVFQFLSLNKKQNTYQKNFKKIKTQETQLTWLYKKYYSNEKQRESWDEVDVRHIYLQSWLRWFVREIGQEE
jgi:hypothetical protein